METNIHPHNYPVVQGHVMVAPAGTAIPLVRVPGPYWTNDGFPREWIMLADHTYVVAVDRGCGCNADQWVIVFRGGLLPTFPWSTDLSFAMSVDTGDVRLDVPETTRCPRDARWRSGGGAYHAGRLTAANPWSVLVPNYTYAHPSALMVCPVPASRIARPVVV